MRNARSLVNLRVAIPLTIVLALAACSTAASPSPSPSGPVVPVADQIAATAAGIQAAMTSYAAGQNNKALEEVTDAYLEHFEFVEAPLEAVDAELTETLEDKIREDLRDMITAGKPVDEVTALGTEILGLLAQAATKLE
jgi:hypothetical protein